MKGDLFGIDGGQGSRISFLLVGIWWMGFGTWAVGRLPKPSHAGTVPKEHVLLNGYRELGKVWNELKHLKILKSYLGAYFFYNMGVQTVMLAAPLYASGELGVPQSNLIISILILQLIAIVGATAISWLSGRIGNIKALIICVTFWIYLCYFGYTLPSGNVNMFYILAVQVGFVMGGIQALSRSTYAKLMPITKDTASFFSFFDVAEKVGIVIGLFLFAYLIEATNSQRISVLSCMSFFIIGMVFLLVTLKRMRNEAARH
jgi:UMF1 family MFS transporter